MSLSRLIRIITATGLVVLLAALAVSPASASGSKQNVAGAAYVWADGKVTIDVADVAKDGHCATARAYLDGAWRFVGSDCSHDSRSKVYKLDVLEGTWLTLSICVGGHTGSRYCHYDTNKVQRYADWSLPFSPGDDGS